MSFRKRDPEGTRGDSYVLPLSDPEDIAHARALIADGPSIGGAIVVARVAPGFDGINRNIKAQDMPPWSWHVTEFEEFADQTVEILDGNPTLVEEDVEFWMENTGGRVGFWGYTVTAELESTPFSQINAGFNDIWRNPVKKGGQGIFVVVLPESQRIFIGWFTYDLMQPPEDAEFILGHAGHRWYTAAGPYDGNIALLELELTQGGIFDSAEVPAQEVVGSVTLKANSCKEMILTYEIFEAEVSGEIVLERATEENLAYCLLLAAEGL